MLFNSYGFIFLFLPLALASFYMSMRFGKEKPELSWGVLLLFSLLFYGIAYPQALPVLLVSLVFNYGCGVALKKGKHPKPVLMAGILADLGLLAYLKYFAMDNFSVPGISFLTFSQIAFLVESFRGALPAAGVVEYSLYAVFFPKLMEGPIALPQQILEQLKKPRRIKWEEAYQCLVLFVLGLFKKVIVADTLGQAVDFGYGNLGMLNSSDALILSLSYTLQLYFDFSGYCDMAMGVAGLFGIELPLNFNSPYKACNIIEFWKGWHITLTGFFTKYLYIPLGGSRKGKVRTYLNCLLVFLISGIWHGTGWQFIIWGLMHGVLYVITRIWLDCRAKGKEKRRMAGTLPAGVNRTAGSIRRGLGVLFTFAYVNAAWVFFRSPSVGEAVDLFQTILRFDFGRINRNMAACFNLDEFWYVIKLFRIDSWQYAHYILMAVFLLAALLIVFWGKNSVDLAREASGRLAGSPAKIMAATMVLAVLFVWSVLTFSEVSSFLYFNF